MHRAPYHGGIKVLAPWIAGGDDRILLSATCDVLATGIDAPMAEESGYLCIQLLVAFIVALPCRLSVGGSVSVGHTSATIQL